MKLGYIANNDLAGLETDCQFAVAEGYEGFEFNYWGDFAKLTAEHVAAQKALLDRYGLACSSFGIWGYNHLASDPAVRAAAHAQIEPAIGFAKQLGADVLILGAGGMDNASNEQQAAEFKSAVSPYVDKAAAAGLRVALYGFHGGSSYLETVDAYASLFAVMDNVGIKLDCANVQHAGQDYLRLLREHAGRVAHVHIKEHLYDGGKLVSQPAAGMGDIQWGKIFAFLYEAGYDGWLVVEPHGAIWSRPPLRWTMLRLTRRYISMFLDG